MVSFFHDSDVGMLISDVPKLSTKLSTVSDLDTGNDCDTVWVLSDAVNAEPRWKFQDQEGHLLTHWKGTILLLYLKSHWNRVLSLDNILNITPEFIY